MKKSNERYQINMIDDKEYDEIDQIVKNKEETLNTYIEFQKMRKFNSQKYIDYLEKESDKRNHMDMSYVKESHERDQISKNYEEKVTDNI